MTERPNDPDDFGFDEIEARLAAYGDVLRGELDEDERRRAAPLFLAATAAPELGASTVSTRRERLRTGVLVAAVLALITAFSFVALRPNDPGTTVQVATEPTRAEIAPAADGLDGSDDAEDTDDADEGASDEGTAAEGDGGDTSTSGAGEADGTDGEAWLSIQPSIDAPNASIQMFDVGLDPTPTPTPTLPPPTETPLSGPASDPAPDEDPTVTPTPEPDAGATPTPTPTITYRSDPAPTPTETPAPSCADGELVNGSCRIVGNPPTVVNLECPADAQQDADGCFTLTLVVDDECDEWDLRFDEDTCLEEIPFVPGPPTCLDDFELDPNDDDRCLRPFDDEIMPCDVGTLVGDNCREIGSPPVNSPPSCPVDPDSWIEEIDGECYRLTEPTCGDLEATQDDLFCILPGTVVDTLVCPFPGLVIIDGDCFDLAIGIGYCPPGVENIGDQCIYIDPPVGDPPTCPDGSLLEPPEAAGCERLEVVLDQCVDGTPANPCTTLYGPPEPALLCVETDLPVSNASECFTQIDLPCQETAQCRELLDKIPGPMVCPDNGFGIADGECVRWTAPNEDECPFELDAAGTCIEVLTSNRYDTCPEGDDILDYANCYRIIPSSNPCGALQWVQDALIGDACRQPVDPIGDSSTALCEQDGYNLEDGECVLWQDPVPGT